MPKRHIAPIVSGRIRLRLLEAGDLAMTLAWRNQDHIRRWFVHAGVVTPEQHAAWFQAYCQKDDDFVFVIEETESLRRAVGQVSLYHVDAASRRAEFGRLMIGEPSAARQGLARLATEAVVAHAFGPCGLEEVYLEVKEANGAAIGVYAACGFAEIGRGGGLVHMARRQARAVSMFDTRENG